MSDTRTEELEELYDACKAACRRIDAVCGRLTRGVKDGSDEKISAAVAPTWPGSARAHGE